MTLNATSRARLRVLLIVAVAFAAVGASFWLGRRSARDQGSAVRIPGRESASGSAENPSPLSQAPVSPNPTPPATPGTGQVPAQSDGISPPSGATENKTAPLPGSYIGTLKLIVPVAGVGAEQLRDTFTDARSEGRSHDAIDIMAPAGTPVVAASDGEIVRLFQSERGGTTIYQLSPDKKLVFYYAHLQGYAEGLAVGKFARQGEVIAYVGDTGNAGVGNYHLHFSIAVLTNPKRYFEGTNINPYPLLRN